MSDTIDKGHNDPKRILFTSVAKDISQVAQPFLASANDFSCDVTYDALTNDEEPSLIFSRTLNYLQDAVVSGGSREVPSWSIEKACDLQKFRRGFEKNFSECIETFMLRNGCDHLNAILAGTLALENSWQHAVFSFMKVSRLSARDKSVFSEITGTNLDLENIMTTSQYDDQIEIIGEYLCSKRKAYYV